MGDVLGGEIVLRGPNPLLKSDLICHMSISYGMAKSHSLNGP